MPISIEYPAEYIQQALRTATKDTLLYMITEAPDNDGNCPAPRGFIRYSDGHLSPDFSSSDYDRALECLKEYILHASYIIDAWRGKPKGSALEIVSEAIKCNEYQYFALEWIAKGFMKTIEENHLLVNYYVFDPSSPECGSGYPDFDRFGEGSYQSTLRAIEISIDPSPETKSVVEAAVYMATHD